MDARFMRAALDEAWRGVGRTAPNPPVGAVVVRDGEIVGRGYHERAGLPHAEPLALEGAGDAATGADLYVTLEPCCHHGRTPPCTDAVIGAGIGRVFYAVADPDPKVAGAGDALLREAGIETHCGLLADEAQELYAPYIKHRRTGTPYGILKMAATLDGKIATKAGESQWLTGEESREYVHQLRNQCDAVMVGSGTVMVDDPQLTCRIPGGRDPVRVVVDSAGSVPPYSKVIDSNSDAPCIIATTDRTPGELAEIWEEAGADVWGCGIDDGRVDLHDLWGLLGQRGLLSVLIEGGPTLAMSALRAGVVDKLLLFLVPKIIGGSEAPSVFRGDDIDTLADALGVEFGEVKRFGPDIMIEAALCSQDS